ncbi:putative Pentatricopeptide repeat domain containing protein [Klebsormidium nitens]|uniref:Putative Pentatricopeptide repeat domain containing protein n=1 Tax=Klebsormidium nitens TaxID=105231 RepID=A0A1Y1I0M0_KLENI|nr:putative Pentatricopeptide repeat domain containing protein [Klebsormidium nitens]|eukprot:GAQ82989.1 putative Pentatricopeptide repeat domain containing protein [Klebsormidium nitens]
MPVPFIAKFAAFWVAKKATVYLAARLYGFPKIYRRLSEVNKRVLFPNDPAKQQKVSDLLQSTFRLPNKIAQQYSEWTGAVQAVPPSVKAVTGRPSKPPVTSPRSEQLNLVPFAAKPAYKKADAGREKLFFSAAMSELQTCPCGKLWRQAHPSPPQRKIAPSDAEVVHSLGVSLTSTFFAQQRKHSLHALKSPALPCRKPKVWCQAQGQSGSQITDLPSRERAGPDGKSESAGIRVETGDKQKWEFVHLATGRLQSLPKRRGAGKNGQEGQNVQKASLEKDAGSARGLDGGSKDASPEEQGGLGSRLAANQRSGSQEEVGTSDQELEGGSEGVLLDGVGDSKGSDQRTRDGRSGRSNVEEQGIRGEGNSSKGLTKGASEQASLKRGDAFQKGASGEKGEAAKWSLEAILAGLDQNAPKADRARVLDAITGFEGEREAEPSSDSAPSQRSRIATSSRLGELTEEPSPDPTTKWEETPVDVSWNAMGTVVSRGIEGPPVVEPQEFARELAELEGFPIGRLGVSEDLGVPVALGLGASERAGSSKGSGDPISRKEARARVRARNLSTQRVVRTLAFLEGVSASHDRKVQKLYKEELLKSAAFQDEAEAVSIGRPALELGELLTPLVGRLSTLELNKVLKGLGERGNWRMAVGLLRWMEAQPQCQPDEWSYSTVLAVLGRQKRSTVAVAVFERMEWRGVRANEYVYSAMIGCYANVREYKDALRTFGKMVAAGVEPNVVTWSALIDACAKGGAGIATCLKLFERMEASFQKELDEQVYNILGDAYAKLGDWESVQTLIRTMEKKGVRPSVITVNTLLDGMGRGDAPLRSLMEVYEGMLRAGGRPSSHTYSILVKACGLRGDLTALDRVWGEMYGNPDWVNSTDKDRVKVYDTVLSVYAERGLVSDALRVFQEIKRQGLKPDRVTYNLLVSALGRSGQLAEAEKILTVMVKDGCPPNVYSYIALMEAYLSAGQLMKVDEVFRRIEGAGLEPTVSAFNLLMQAYVSRGNLKQAGSLLTEMRKQGRQPNATSYAILIRAHSTSAVATSASATSAPTSAAGDAFLAPFRIVELFDEMKEREAVGLLPREALADVIRALCACGRLAQATDPLRELVSVRGGGSDAAALGEVVVSACMAGGDVQRLPVAVGGAVEAGWDLAPHELPGFLRFLAEGRNGGLAEGSAVERVLGALRGAPEGGLGRALCDATLSGGSNQGENDGGETGSGTVTTGEALDKIAALLEAKREPKEEGVGDGVADWERVDDVTTGVDEKRVAEGGLVETESASGVSDALQRDSGGLFDFVPGCALPSTAELERVFDGLGLGLEDWKGGPGSEPDLPPGRFKKIPVEVQWPQRRLPLPWGGPEGGVATGRSAPAKSSKNGRNVIPVKEGGQNGSLLEAPSSAEQEPGAPQARVQKPEARGATPSANTDTRYASFLARVEDSLSAEDLRSVRTFLAALTSEFERGRSERVVRSK